MHESLQTPKLTPATVITTEAEKILGTIIFRTRLAKGWNGYDERTQKMAVMAWFEILNRQKIPPKYYDELYGRACDVRAVCLRNGKEPPEISAELMAAQWEGLAEEIRQKEIDAERFLPATAESDCPRCFGKNREFVYDEASGRILGVKNKPCDPPSARAG
jgi:hypothetical protein